MSLIQCHFDYACSFWITGFSKKWKQNLQITQNKLIRFILNLHHRTHISKEHFELLGWLPVEQRVHQIILCHVYKIHNNLAPSYLHENFVQQNTVHSYRTRFSSDGCFCISSIKSAGAKSFVCNVCSMWNHLPVSLKNVTTLKQVNYL